MSMRNWLAGAGLVALAVSTGACGGTSSDDVTSDLTATPTSAATSAARTESAPATSAPAANSPVLSGDRQVTITLVDGFEGGLSLTDEGRLGLVDGDEGRQLFVPTPLSGQEFLIRSYRGAGGGPGTGEPACWQVQNPGNSQPLVVQGADCDENEAHQRFTIAPVEGTEEAYVISNSSAYLFHSSNSGLILEELGDSDPMSSFRFNDNGPAPEQS